LEFADFVQVDVESLNIGGHYGRRNEIIVSTDGEKFYDFLSDCEEINEELLHEIIR